jgi:hypothetical protein
MEEVPDRFAGFRDSPGASEGWLRADLVYTRRRRPDSFTVARPVHLEAARIRNPKENNDSFASLHVYSWIQHADPSLLTDLKGFLEPDAAESLDLPSLALKLLGQEQPKDQPRPGRDATREPLCWIQAKTYAEDIRAILAYRHALPRTSIIDHIRRLTGLHVGLHLMRMFRIVSDVERSRGAWACSGCEARGIGGAGCSQPLEIVVDCGEDQKSRVAKYAEMAWLREEEWIARYVRSHLALKKLHEFALSESKRGREYPHGTLQEIASLETTARVEDLDRYFEGRVQSLQESVDSDAAAVELVNELERDHRRLGLSYFRTYHEMLCHYSQRRWVSYHRWLLDSFLGKNAADGLLRQPIGGRRVRRAVLSPGLLETLVLASAVRFDDDKPRTAVLRVDQVIQLFRERYGLLIADAPTRDADDPLVIRELADNTGRFKSRLRETGLFVDQSDAYLAQTVRPRIRL